MVAFGENNATLEFLYQFGEYDIVMYYVLPALVANAIATIMLRVFVMRVVKNMCHIHSKVNGNYLDICLVLVPYVVAVVLMPLLTAPLMFVLAIALVCVKKRKPVRTASGLFMGLIGALMVVWYLVIMIPKF